MDGVIPTPNRAKEFEFVVHLSTGVAGAMQRWRRCTELAGIIIILCQPRLALVPSKRWGGYLISAKKTMERPFLESAHCKEGALRVLLQAVTKDFSSSSSSCCWSKARTSAMPTPPSPWRQQWWRRLAEARRSA
jgi:hypothetical protein